MRGEDGWPILSPSLISENEIDSYIQLCKEDLDRVGKEAKRALRDTNSRTIKRLKEIPDDG